MIIHRALMVFYLIYSYFSDDAFQLYSLHSIIMNIGNIHHRRHIFISYWGTTRNPQSL